MSLEEQERLLIGTRDVERNNDNESEEEEWSDSSCSSYYSDTDSSIPEWESMIDPSGQLLFIDCYPVVTQTSIELDSKSNFTKNQLRRSTRSKFLRLIRRRESKRKSKRFPKNQDNVDAGSTNKVTFHDQQEGEIKEVVLKIEAEGKYKLGRRATLVETLLGINVSTLSDGCRIMVAGFTPDSEAKNDKNIKIGDWLKMVNGVEVTVQNLNVVLEQVVTKNEIVLQLQRVAGVEVTKDPPTNELSNQSKFVQQLTSFNTEEEQQLSCILCQYPIGILYINTENLTETGPEYDGIIYCYPRPMEKNKLCSSRGIYITLNHLLQEITKEKPRITSAFYNQKLSHIVYSTYGKNLLLFMLPDNRSSSKEIILLNNELVRMLEFTYQSVEKCFEDLNYRSELDHFFSRFFTRILTSGLWLTAEQCVDLRDLPTRATMQSPPQFEDVLPAGQFLTLPTEAQMQIDDALNELEASDYREWNEDPLDCQRLFTILGSAFYHAGVLLASHFVHGDLIDVHLYCRQQGLLHLSRSEPIRCMVLWREVFPFSCNRGLQQPPCQFKFPEGRRYLLIVGSGKDLLAVIMEAGGCTEPAEEGIGPDAFYVEEAQATLAHLQELGVPELAERYLLSNPGAQVTVPEPSPPKRKSDLLGTINFSKSSPNLSKGTASPVQKKPEVTSILKRRGSDQGPLSHSGSAFSLPDDNYEMHSEDSTSQGGYSERSEISDEPVLGRRAIRERKNFNGSDGEESDFDDFGEGSQVTGSSYDLSEIRQSLLSDAEDTEPLRLTAGLQNVLFHYVQFDETEGVLLCPPECKLQTKTLALVLNNFRICCQNIRNLFQSTLRFKNMPTQDMAKSMINKSLIAIKEHGVLFECSFQEENNKKISKLTFWVVGRLFYMHHPQELYICYKDSVPQNLIEVAFKLGVSQSGLI